MNSDPRGRHGLRDGDNFFVLRALDVGVELEGYPAVNPVGDAPVFSFEEGPPSPVPFTEVAVVDPAISTSNAVMSFDRLSGQFYLTRHRSVLFCADYDKGARLGCGIGAVGIVIVGVVWLVRRLRAKRRSSGKVLVGQIFHADLVEVGGTGDTVVLRSGKPRSGRPIITIVTFATSEIADHVRSTLNALAAHGPAPHSP